MADEKDPKKQIDLKKGQVNKHIKGQLKFRPQFMKNKTEYLSEATCRIEFDNSAKNYETFKTKNDGTIDTEDGTLTAPTDAKRCALFVKLKKENDDDEIEYEYNIDIDELEEVEELTGVQGRLNNLGYDSGEIDGKMGPITKAAVEAFQAANELAVDGIPGPKTQKKIKDTHDNIT